jgi:hypothetical protein
LVGMKRCYDGVFTGFVNYMLLFFLGLGEKRGTV